MKGNCFEIGTFQAFLDGELEQAESLRVSGHVAVCDACAAMLAEAEDESAIVFPALEREFNTLVPTRRLWNKINDAIVVEAEQAPFWKKAWAILALQIANPSIAMAASVLLIFGLFAAVWISRNGVTTNEPTSAVAGNQKTESPIANVAGNPTPFTAGPDQPADGVIRRDDNVRNMAINASFTKARTPRIVSPGPNSSSGSLPGEESYVKTIASLSRSVENEKDSVMRPSERISYERDMAVVDDAIAKMKTEVKKNPKNESAKQVLYASYQNKIDLLNSVSQKQELMASLR